MLLGADAHRAIPAGSSLCSELENNSDDSSVSQPNPGSPVTIRPKIRGRPCVPAQ